MRERDTRKSERDRRTERYLKHNRKREKKRDGKNRERLGQRDRIIENITDKIIRNNTE